MYIRRATLADAPGIARVHVASWQTTYAGLLPADYIAEHTLERRLQQAQAGLASDNSHSCTFVALDDAQEVIGFASGGPSFSYQDEYAAQLYALYLLQTHQRGGIGRALLRALAQHLAEQGRTSMLTWVLVTNPARRFYEAMGGQRIAEKTDTLGGVPIVEIGYGWRDIRPLAVGPHS